MEGFVLQIVILLFEPESLVMERRDISSEYGNELTRGPLELVQHFLYRGFTSAQERCMS